MTVTYSYPGSLSTKETESFDTVYLDPTRVSFRYDAAENLTFTDVDGNFYPRVTLRRCFPLSADNQFIVVRVPDVEPDTSHELGILLDCQELDEPSRQAVRRELTLYYLVPAIQRVVSIREEFGFLYWVVETDRGRKEFVMRDSIIGSTRQVAMNRWLIIDINQTRYEIHEFTQLDEISQNLLSKHLLL